MIALFLLINYMASDLYFIYNKDESFHNKFQTLVEVEIMYIYLSKGQNFLDIPKKSDDREFIVF